MLSFEEKLAIADSFPELQRKDVSMGRVNYHYEQSAYDKKTVVYHLHPNGNGFVYAADVVGYIPDERGYVNIRDFSADKLRSLIAKSIRSLTADAGNKRKSDESPDASEPAEQTEQTEQRWTNALRQSLALRFEEEDGMWYIFAGDNLDSMFETYEEAEQYLHEEGFLRESKY